jgi:hypothetical protein
MTVRVRLSARQAEAVRALVHQAVDLAAQVAHTRPGEVELSRQGARALMVAASFAVVDRQPHAAALGAVAAKLEVALGLTDATPDPTAGERP